MHDDSVKGASLPAADRERTEPRGASYYRNRRSLLPNRAVHVPAKPLLMQLKQSSTADFEISST
ncbi:hypothetical protein PGT21_031238 [Puccinia graminis f. sp. tritici]|uniref:Uncharacterized protein n=1 Tax=Puccinia graminis f. sp. tritici TaxID=56615 RepID=A0A5B0QCB4_PUCGR|nr:hypothetical protein PGT21_031238 [Puccinia graminis f. sp. tritici]